MFLTRKMNQNQCLISAFAFENFHEELTVATGEWQKSLTRFFFLLQSLEQGIPEEREGGLSTLTLRLLNPQEEGSFQCTALLAYAALFGLSCCQVLFLVSTESFCQAFALSLLLLLLLLWASLLWPCIYFPSFVSSLIRYFPLFSNILTPSFVTFVFFILSSPFSACCC